MTSITTNTPTVEVASTSADNATSSVENPSLPSHFSGLRKSATTLKTAEGQVIEVWELSTPKNPNDISDWAKSFRQQYCPDSEIDSLREGTGMSRANFLVGIVFPDKSVPPGPGVRSGDFAELLISDYVEYLLGYWVPRGKYAEKATRNESVKGVDILGFKIATPGHVSPEDTLFAFEVKAQCAGGKYDGRLQTAVDDSSKDYLRRAFTLNATKRRLLTSNEGERALVVQRFQNLADHPYIYRSGAAAVLSDEAYDEAAITASTSVEHHSNKDNLDLLVIRGKELMMLVHALYQRAADEA